MIKFIKYINHYHNHTHHHQYHIKSHSISHIHVIAPINYHHSLTSINCGRGAAGYWKKTFLVFSTAFVNDFTPSNGPGDDDDDTDDGVVECR